MFPARSRHSGYQFSSPSFLRTCKLPPPNHNRSTTDDNITAYIYYISLKDKYSTSNFQSTARDTFDYCFPWPVGKVSQPSWLSVSFRIHKLLFTCTISFDIWKLFMENSASSNIGIYNARWQCYPASPRNGKLLFLKFMSVSYFVVCFFL